MTITFESRREDIKILVIGGTSSRESVTVLVSSMLRMEYEGNEEIVWPFLVLKV